jgi:hypothetical protein
LGIKAFEVKLKLINKHAEDRNFVHFRSCKSVFETSGEERFAWPKEEFKKNYPTASKRIITKIQRFHSHSSEILLFRNSFKVNISVVNELQMEIIELQANDSLKNAFEPSDLRILYSGVTSEVFPKIRKFSAGMRTVFASTYMCE